MSLQAVSDAVRLICCCLSAVLLVFSRYPPVWRKRGMLFEMTSLIVGLIICFTTYIITDMMVMMINITILF